MFYESNESLVDEFKASFEKINLEKDTPTKKSLSPEHNCFVSLVVDAEF